MQLTLKAAVATHVLDVFTGWFTPSVLQIIGQKSHNLVRLSDEYILCCDLDYDNFDLNPERVIKYNTMGPFYHHGLTLIPAWISNHMPRKVWAEITYPFQNFNGCTVEFWELITNFIPLYNGSNNSSMLGLKLIHVSKRVTWNEFCGVDLYNDLTLDFV